MSKVNNENDFCLHKRRQSYSLSSRELVPFSLTESLRGGGNSKELSLGRLRGDFSSFFRSLSSTMISKELMKSLASLHEIQLGFLFRLNISTSIKIFLRVH
jgi:hypothetical protein